ncbi:MAG: YebC/PmpR family DNA-binding transcriptional regulator [Bdellovibrionales bacterium]|nr:YebC/PmpR family DNA-binding transcriptional regulator [Bdellovibrionales bacterium]NQZ18500.1 YebC/PmpR family DNA-binding transcriptional regulator [Bdellovibrionales bacterium]
MGKSWKNPHKVAAAAKKGAAIAKMAKEITIAAKLGGGDPDANPRLRLAINTARGESVPKDTIERAIKKGTGELDDGKTIEEVMYEGYAPHQVGILVECQTDNRARTAPDIRFIFKKFKGQMGEQGSITWMFDRIGLVEGTGPADREFDAEEEAIEALANEVEAGDEGLFSFYTDPEDVDSVQKALADRGWEIKTCELSYRAKNKTQDLTEEQKNEIYEFLEALDDNEDTSRIHTTL